METQQLVTN